MMKKKIIRLNGQNQTLKIGDRILVGFESFNPFGKFVKPVKAKITEIQDVHVMAVGESPLNIPDISEELIKENKWMFSIQDIKEILI